MSVSHPDSLKFFLRDEEGDQEDLRASYDEQADILYLWIGERPSEAFSVTSDEGHLIRLDPKTYSVVGLTIFDFCRRWQADDPGGEFKVSLPSLGEDEGEVAAPRELELVAS